jgi:ribose transport system permease protein
MSITTSAAPAAATDIRSWKTRLRALGSGTGGPLIGLLVLGLALFIATPYFLTVNNLLNILDQVTILGVLALGMTFVIVTGGIDLSVGAVLALSIMVLGYTSHNLGIPLPLSILLAVLAGGLCGLLTLLVAGAAYMRYRPGGRALYAIGGSPEVARLAGIGVKKVTASVYVVMGLLAGLAGVVLAARLDSSQPSAASGIELDTIAAVVIGGASLSGGVGRITGTIVGVLIIGVLRNGLNLLSVSPFVQQIVIGVVIALAVMVDVLRRRDA